MGTAVLDILIEHNFDLRGLWVIFSGSKFKKGAFQASGTLKYKTLLSTHPLIHVLSHPTQPPHVRLFTAAGNVSTFACGQWFNQDTTSMLLSSNNTVATYNLRVFTADDSDAGFDGDAYVTFFGGWGSSGEVKMVNDSVKYAPGSCEKFVVEAGGVNAMSKIELRVVS